MSKQGTKSESDMKSEAMASILTSLGMTNKQKREQIKKLIDEGANINYKFSYVGETLLHIACGLGGGDLEIIKMLIEHGANPNARDDLGRTPLHQAGINDYGEVFDYLTEQGADKTIAYRYGKNSYTPEDSLQNARNHKEEYKDERREHQEFKDMILGRRKAVRDAIEKNDFEGFIRSLNLLNAVDYMDHTVSSPLLSFAAGLGRHDMMKELIKRGADVNHLDLDFSYPLHHAIAAKNIEAIKVLLERGADPNKKITQRKTPSPLEFAQRTNAGSEIINLLKGIKQEQKINIEQTVPVAPQVIPIVSDSSVKEVKQTEDVKQKETEKEKEGELPSTQMIIKLELGEAKKASTTKEKLSILAAIESEYQKVIAEIDKLNQKRSDITSQKQKLKEMKNMVGYFSASSDEDVKKRACAFADKNGIPRRQDTIVRQLISRFKDPTTLEPTENPTYSVEEIRKMVAGAFFDEKQGFQVGLIRDIKEAYNPDDTVEHKIAFVKNALLVLSAAIELDPSGKSFPLLVDDGPLQKEYQNLVVKLKEDAEKIKNPTLQKMVNHFETSISDAIKRTKETQTNLNDTKKELITPPNDVLDVQAYISQELQHNPSRSKMDSVAQQIADDLYNLAAARMLSIDITDIMGKRWEKDKNSSINLFSDEYNKLTAKVVDDILGAQNKEHQENIAKLYAKVFKHALESGNYHFATAIALGLYHSSISKLQHVTQLPEVKVVVKELGTAKDETGKVYEGVLSQSFSYKQLRKRLEEDAKQGKGAIPLLSMHLGDLVFSSENKSSIDDPANPKKEDEQEPQQIKNTSRMALLGRTVKAIQNSQEVIRKRTEQRGPIKTNIIKGITQSQALIGEKDVLVYVYADSWNPRPITLKNDTALSRLNELTAVMIKNYAITGKSPSLMKLKKEEVNLIQDKAYLEMLSIINRDLPAASIKDQFSAFKLVNLIEDAATRNNLIKGKLKKEIEKARSLLEVKSEDLKNINDIDKAITDYKQLKIKEKRSRTEENQMSSLFDKISNYHGPMENELKQGFAAFNQGVNTFNSRTSKLEQLKGEFDALKKEVPIDLQKLFQLNNDVTENEKLINYGKKEGKPVIDSKIEGDYHLGAYARTLSVDKEFTVELDNILFQQLKSFLASIDKNIRKEDVEAFLALYQKYQTLTGSDYPETNSGYKSHFNENISLLSNIVKKLKDLEVIPQDVIKISDKPKAATTSEPPIPSALPQKEVPKDTVPQEVMQGAEAKPAAQEALVAKVQVSAPVNVGQMVRDFTSKISEGLHTVRSDEEFKALIREVAKIYSGFPKESNGQIKPLDDLILPSKTKDKNLLDNAQLLVKALENIALITPDSVEELRRQVNLLADEKELDSVRNLLSTRVETMVAKFAFAEPAQVKQVYENLKGRYQQATIEADKNKAKQELDDFENKLRKYATTKNKALRARVVSVMAENGILGRPEDSFVRQILSGYKDPTNFRLDLEDTDPGILKYTPEEIKLLAAPLLSAVRPESVLDDLNALVSDTRIDLEQRKQIIKNASRFMMAMMNASIHSPLFDNFKEKLTLFYEQHEAEFVDVQNEMGQFKQQCMDTLQINANEERSRIEAIAKAKQKSPLAQSVETFLDSKLLSVIPKTRGQKKEIMDATELMAKQFADDLRRHNIAQLLDVKPTDLHNQAWAKEKTKDKTNLINLTRDFNSIVNMVAMDIVKQKTIVGQESVARFYLKVAEHAYQSGDFNTLTAINAAFKLSGIQRLAHIVNFPENKAFFEQTEVANVLNKDKFRIALEQEKSKGKKIVPYVGNYLTDITFTEDGNRLERQDPHDSTRPPQLNSVRFGILTKAFDAIQSAKEDLVSEAQKMGEMQTDLLAKMNTAKYYTDDEITQVSESFRGSKRTIISFDEPNLIEELKNKNPAAIIPRIFEGVKNGKTVSDEEALIVLVDKLNDMEQGLNTLDKEYLQSLVKSINAWINDKDNQAFFKPKELEKTRAKILALSRKVEFDKHDGFLLPKLISIREMGLFYLHPRTDKTRVNVTLDKIFSQYEMDKNDDKVKKSKKMENEIFYREAQQTSAIIAKLGFIDLAINKKRQDMAQAPLFAKLSFVAENQVVKNCLDDPIVGVAKFAREAQSYDEATLALMRKSLLEHSQVFSMVSSDTLNDAEVANAYQQLVNKMAVAELTRDMTTQVDELPVIHAYKELLDKMMADNVSLEEYLQHEFHLEAIKAGIEALSVDPELDKNVKTRITAIKNKMLNAEVGFKEKFKEKSKKLKEEKRKEYDQTSKETLSKNKEAINVSVPERPLTALDQKLLEIINKLEKNLDEYQLHILKVAEQKEIPSENRLLELDTEIKHALGLMDALKYGVNFELSEYPELKQIWKEMNNIKDTDINVDEQKILSGAINENVKAHSIEVRNKIKDKLAQYTPVQLSRQRVARRKMAKPSSELKAQKPHLLKVENKMLLDKLVMSEQLPPLPDNMALNAVVDNFCQYYDIKTTINEEEKEVQPKDSIPARVYRELLGTEISYINSLFVVDKALIGEMLDKYDTLNTEQLSGFSSKAEFIDLIAKYNQIRETQHQVITNLQNPDPSVWFNHMDQMSKLYIDFTKSFNDLQLPKDVREVINTGKKQQQQIFGAIWIQPIQRFPRYVMLLQDLGKRLSGQYSKQFGENFDKAMQGLPLSEPEHNKERILAAVALVKQVQEQYAKVEATTQAINYHKKISEDRPKVVAELHGFQADPNKNTSKNLADVLEKTSLTTKEIIEIFDKVGLEKCKPIDMQLLIEHAKKKHSIDSKDTLAAYFQTKIANDQMKAYLQKKIEKAAHKGSDQGYRAMLNKIFVEFISMMQTPPYVIDINSLKNRVKSDPDNKQQEKLFSELQNIQSKAALSKEEIAKAEVQQGSGVAQEEHKEQLLQVENGELAAQLDHIAEVRDKLFDLIYARGNKNEIDRLVEQHQQLKEDIEKYFPLQANLFRFREMLAMDVSHYNYQIRSYIHSFSQRVNYENLGVVDAITRFRTRQLAITQDNSLSPELRQRIRKDLQALDQVLKTKIEENKEEIVTYVKSKNNAPLTALVNTIALELLQIPKPVPMQQPIVPKEAPVQSPSQSKPAPQSQIVLIQRDIKGAYAEMEEKLQRYLVAQGRMEVAKQTPMTNTFLVNILNIRNRLVRHKLNTNAEISLLAAAELKKIDTLLSRFIDENPDKLLTLSLQKNVPSSLMLKMQEDTTGPSLDEIIELRNQIIDLRLINESERDNQQKEENALEISRLEQVFKEMKKGLELYYPSVKNLYILRELIAIDQHNQNYKVRSFINRLAQHTIHTNPAVLRAIARHRERLLEISQDLKQAPALRQAALQECQDVDKRLVAMMEENKDIISARISPAKTESDSILAILVKEIAPALLSQAPPIKPKQAAKTMPWKTGIMPTPKWEDGKIQPEVQSIPSSDETLLSVSNSPPVPERRRSLTLEKQSKGKQEELLTHNTSSINVLPKFFQAQGGQEGELDKAKMKSYGVQNIIPRKILKTEEELTIQMAVEKDQKAPSKENQTVDITARAGKNGGVVYSIKHSDVTLEQKNKALEKFCRAYVFAAEPGTTFTLPAQGDPQRNELVKGFLSQALKERCEKEGIPFKPEALEVPGKAKPMVEDQKKAAPKN